MNWEESQLKRFDNITNRELENLLRKDSTEFHFQEIEAKIQNVIDNVILLKDNYEFWDLLPDDTRNMINTKIDQISAIFDQMETFDPKQQNNPWSSRNGLIQNFLGEYREFYSYLIEKLNAFLGQRAFNQELTSKFGKQADESLRKIKAAQRQIEKVQKEVEEASSVTSNVASTATAVYFDEQAKEHSDQARYWLIAVCISSGAALVLATLITLDYVFKIQKVEDFFTNKAVSAVSLLVLAFSFIIVRFTSKNYSINRHLYVTNKHRSNALKSMEAFRTGARDDASKDAILLAGVNTAYSSADTGFVNSSPNNSDDSVLNEIVSILRKDIR